MKHMHIPRSPPLQMPSGVSWENEEENIRLLEARRALLKAKEDLSNVIPSTEGSGGEWGEYGGGVVIGSGVGGGDGFGRLGYTRPPMARAGAGAISSRATDSQREAKERLARTQRRRLELMGERRQARNWNLKDDDEVEEEGTN